MSISLKNSAKDKDKAQKTAPVSRVTASGDREGDVLLAPGILDRLQDAVFTADLEGTITSCNRGVQRYGFTPSDLVGGKIADLYPDGLYLDGRDLDGRALDGRALESGGASAVQVGGGPAVQPRFTAAQALILVLDSGRFEGELLCRAKSGENVPVHLCLNLLNDSNPATAVILGYSIAIAAKSSAESLSSAISSATSGQNSSPDSSSSYTTPGAVPMSRREIDGTQFLIASPLMHKFMGMVDRVAGHTETVLVTGETGTGKELVARTIHDSSYRCKKGLVDINCAALPEHLVESELFGYEKGAFSGAESSKPGLFEMADKSTIFLDEIGELQPQIQVKLLRVLDGAPYYRLGGSKKITVDVRVVAATNQDLELAVKEGRFRKDLFHRLSQFQLRVPPLRDRPEDIAALARHFLSLKAPSKVLSGEALAALQAYAWPGNIRELRNLVAKLAMANEDRQISAAAVVAELYGEPLGGSSSERRGSDAVPLGNLENMEEQMIIRALKQTGGHRSQAAERLGISRRTLSRKLREYEIEVPSGDDSARLGIISEDQQKFFRAKVNCSVTLTNAQGKELQVQAINLSTGGMGLDVVADPTGFAGLVDVSFLLPETEIVILAKGRLVWSDAGGRAGLRFVVVEPELFEKLQHWTNRKMKDEGWEVPS